MTWRVAVFALAAAVSAEDYEGRSTLLLHKHVSPATGPYNINSHINITLTVYNKGPGNAYSLMVNDDNWKNDKFRVISAGNNFTLDYLNAGDSFEHEFTVKPIRKMWHRVRPAKMAFVDGVEGEKTIMHLSNSLPEMRVVAREDKLEDSLLTFGRVITLNTIKTKKGWLMVAALCLGLFMVQLYFIGSAVLQKRRHLRALDDVKKM